MKIRVCHSDFQAIQDIVPMPVLGMTKEMIVYSNEAARQLGIDGARFASSNIILLKKATCIDTEEKEITYQFFRKLLPGEKDQYLAGYLDQVVRELAGARDMESALRVIARLIVPRFADWLTIDLIDEGELCELMIHCDDEEKLDWARDYRSRYAISLEGSRTRAQVIRTGKPVLITDMTKEQVLSRAKDVTHPYIKEAFKLRSVITVPIRNRTMITGVIRLLTSLPGRRYDKEDLIFAQNFAAHVGLVIENAQLMEAAQKEITQRKLMERQLRLTQLRLQSALSSGLVGTWIVDIDNGIVHPDESLCKMLGVAYNATGCDQKTLMARMLPEDRQLAERNARQIFNTEQQYESEYRIMTNEGIRWILTRGRAEKDENGHVSILAGIAVDVTARKAFEQALRESNERYTAAFQNAGVGILLSNTEGRLLQSNAAFSRITGYSETALTDISYIQITHPDDIARNRELYAKLFKGELSSFIFEKRYRHSNGHYVWVRNSTSLVRNTEDRPAYAITITEDITEQKRAEDELKASEAHFKALTQLNSLPIWQINDRCEMLFVNDTWRSYTGVQHNNITGEHWSKNIHPQDREATVNAFGELFSHKEPVSLKYRFLHAPTGNYRWILDTALPVFNPDFQGYIGTMADIEEQEQARLRVQEQIARVQ